MDVYVLNTDFETTFVLDFYESLMWVDRYYGYGEFEIYAPFDNRYIQNLVQGYYLKIDASDRVMIIESIQLQTDAETGSHLIIRGRSLESILDRRIIYPMFEIKNNNCYIQTAIKALITDCIINPTRIPNKVKRKDWILRKIDNFIFTDTDDSRIIGTAANRYKDGIKVDPVEMTGDNLYDVIVDWCQENEIGFRIFLTEENQFEFKLYMGEDRSYDQEENLWVIFSPEFENIISTEYIDDITPWKNYALIAGEGEGNARYNKVYGDLKTSGLEHRELFVDARDIQTEDLPDEQTYDEALIARGLEQLNENYKDIEFTGEVEAKRQFVYGVDFFVGDIIQIVDTYGIEGAARVTEFVINDTANGLEMYPTFEAIQNEDYEEGEVT